MNYRISGLFTTKSPLSHISEAISTNSYLVQEPILQQDGTLEEVFCYNGNAWRGQLRDCAAISLLNSLDCQISLEAFHLLFTGGKIGGDQSIDIEQARAMRSTVPMISLFGGGIGNQILSGKMKVGNSYPLCTEALSVLPFKHHDEAQKVSYADLTFEKSFTRFDDIKDLDKQALSHEQPTDKKKKEVSTQMRMTSELLVSGVKLAHEIDLVDVSMVEIGALVAALSLFAQTPYIGGQSNKGHGRVHYASKITNTTTGEEHNFVWVHDELKLSDFAKDALNAYQAHVDSNKDNIAKLLGAKCG